MKNATKTYREISFYTYAVPFAIGVLLAISVNPVLAQYFSLSDEKLDIIDPTPSEKKYATTTFVSLDTYTKVKENYENTEKITKRLDTIIVLLQKIYAK